MNKHSGLKLYRNQPQPVLAWVWRPVCFQAGAAAPGNASLAWQGLKSRVQRPRPREGWPDSARPPAGPEHCSNRSKLALRSRAPGIQQAKKKKVKVFPTVPGTAIQPFLANGNIALKLPPLQFTSRGHRGSSKVPSVTYQLVGKTPPKPLHFT